MPLHRDRSYRSFFRAVLLGAASLTLISLNLSAQTWELGNSIPGIGDAGGAVAVRDLETWDPDGAGPLEPVLVVAGSLQIPDVPGATNIAIWDGQSWAPLGMGLGVYTGSFGGDSVAALAVLPTGELVAGGRFETSGSASVPYLAVWTGTQWQPLGGGADNDVEALAVSATGELAVGGGFNMVGSTSAEHVAIWNGSWTPLGTGTGSDVEALAYLDNGDLVVGGRFTTAGGVASSGVAIWDGLMWQGMDGGVDLVHGGGGDVFALAADGNAVIVGGDFNHVGGQGGNQLDTNNVARWTGTSWQEVGGGLPRTGLGGIIWSLEMVHDPSSPTGPSRILAVGAFFDVGAGEGVALFDNFSWGSLGDADINCGNLTDGYCSLQLPNGHIVVGGRFACLDGTERLLPGGLARWDGTKWWSFGRGADGHVHAITTVSGNRQLIGGEFEGIGGQRAHRSGLLDNGQWSGFDDFLSGDGLSAAEFDGDFYLGVDGHAGCFRWSGTSWSSVMLGGGHAIHALEPLSNGQGLVAGGLFTQGGAENIALWDGSTWSPLGGNLNGAAHCLLDVPGVGLYCGGAFSTAAGTTVNGLALWDGMAWNPVGGGVIGPVYALTLDSNGDLIVGGMFTTVGGGTVAALNVARWDGAAWSPLGAGLDNTVYALARHPDDTIFAGGIFPYSGATQVNNLAAFDGQTWQSLGGGTNGPVRALDVDALGTLHVGGEFTSVGAGIPSSYYARWFQGAPPVTFDRGDCNDNGAVNLADAVTLLTYLFVPNTAAPNCQDACDANDDGALNLADAIILLNYLFAQGFPPAAPWGFCGTDGTADMTPCTASAACP